MALWARVWSLLLLGYLLFGRSFAYLGIPPLFIGEMVLGAFFLSRPGAVLGRWVSWLAARRVNPLSSLAWSLTILLFYGLFQVLFGLRKGHDLLYTLQNLAFNVYPLYLFLGLAVGLRYPSLLRKAIWWLAWFNGIYGVLYVLILDRIDLFLPWAPDVYLFSRPFGSFVALMGLVAFEPRLHRSWFPLLLNTFVLLGVQVRGEWLAFALALAVWAFLRGRILQLAVPSTGVLLLLAAFYVTDLRLPAPERRGGEISVQGIVARVVAPFNPDLAAELIGEEAYSLAGTIVEWRVPWWMEIWHAVHADFATALLGLGYGYPLWGLYPLILEGVRTPHNIFFYTLGYTGWLGVFLFAFFLVSLIAALYRAARRNLNGKFALASSCGFIGSALVGNFFESPFGAIPFFLLAGFGLAPLVEIKKRGALKAAFRTPLTPGGNIALPPADTPRSRDGGPG
jgi:hypothetical protein